MSRPVNAFSRNESVMQAMKWLTPLGSMSDLILSTTSSGVPATESLSAIVGRHAVDRSLDVSIPEGVEDGLHVGLRDAVALHLLDRHGRDVEGSDGLGCGFGLRRSRARMANTFQTAMSRSCQLRPARSAPILRCSTM